MAPLVSLLAAHKGGRRLAYLALIVLGLAVVGALAWKEIAPPAASEVKQAVALPPPLQSADPSIIAVMVEAPEAVVWADVKNSADFPAVMDKAQEIAGAIGRRLKEGVIEDLSGVQTVRLRFRADGVDRFGHDVMAPLMTLEVDRKALENATGPKVLGLARTVTLNSPGSFDAVGAWCKDQARADAAFCAKTPVAKIGPA
jgi:hypothetical protein